jgi:hypothetical protein
MEETRLLPLGDRDVGRLPRVTRDDPDFDAIRNLPAFQELVDH